MKFITHPQAEIKGKVSSLGGYSDLLKKNFSGSIAECLTGDINIFESQKGKTYRYIFESQGEQIGDCNVIVDHMNQTFYVSSIAIVKNLQKNGIGRSFYDTYLTPRFSELFPDYMFIKGPKQTELGEKLWKK